MTHFRRYIVVLSALAVALAAPARLLAADEESSGGGNEAPQLSDAVGDGLAKLEPLIKDKKWDEALQLVQGLIDGAKAESYDQCFLNETEAQIFTQKGDYPAAIKPLETAVDVADRHHYFNTKQEEDMLYFLAQLYSVQADSAKNDRELQLASFEKAITYIKRWFQIAPRPTEDISLYYSQLLYGAAVAKDPAHPDAKYIQLAREQVEKTLLLTAHPKDSLYQFLLATLQQQLDYRRAAEILELMLAKNPNNKAYWQDLNMFYMALAQNPKDKNLDEIRKFNIRAINTIERAQALGYLKTPRDNYTLFTLYYNIGQYSLASDVLQRGLETGGIDSTIDNWQLLAACYQQLNQDFKAIHVLTEATEKFPQNGELEYKIAQIYLGLDNNDEAFAHAKTAVEKDHLLKPQQVYMFLAYMAYELQKLDDAKEAIDRAYELLNGRADRQTTGLKNAIDEAVKDRDSRKAAAAPAPSAANP